MKSDIVSIVSPSISHEVMGTRGEGGINWEIGFNILISVAVVQSLSSVELFVTHGLQHTRLPCPSPTSGACSNSCPPSW